MSTMSDSEFSSEKAEEHYGAFHWLSASAIPPTFNNSAEYHHRQTSDDTGPEILQEEQLSWQ